MLSLSKYSKLLKNPSKGWLDEFGDGGWLDAIPANESTSTKGNLPTQKMIEFESNKQDEQIQIQNNPKIEVKPDSLIQKYADNERIKLDQVKNTAKYYKNYNPKNSLEVTRLQTELVQNGYKLPKYGIDGKFGNETKKAYESYIKDKQENVSKTDFSEEESKKTFNKPNCMEYVSYVTNNKALGDAWTVENNLKKERKQIKYNIYTDPRFKNVHNTSELIKVTEEVKKDNKATADMFQVGDVVGLFYKPSNMHETALKEGRGTYNTHAGVVTSIKDGVPIISHNIHGKLYHQPYNQLTIGWIGESGAKPIIKYEDTIKSQSSNIKELIPKYADDLITKLGVKINKEQVKKDIAGILTTESNLGKLSPSEFSKTKSKYVKKLIGDNSNDDNISQGAGKIKLNTLSLEDQKFLDTNIKDLNTNSGAVKTATYIYLKNYENFDKYAKANPQLKLTSDDIRLLTILSYNQGTSKLSNFGYNKNNMTFEQELQELRKLKSGKVNDISSSNLKYIPLIGQILYDIEYKGGHNTYPSRVLKHGEEAKQWLNIIN